jgi:hypothetical protein
MMVDDHEPQLVPTIDLGPALAIVTAIWLVIAAIALAAWCAL